MSPRITKADWELWNKERLSFANRDTVGFIRDIRALETHIKNLKEICPRDAVGSPAIGALHVLDKLTADLKRFKRYFKTVTG